MPIPNRISAVLTPATQKKVLALLDEIDGLLPFTVALSPAEKKGLTKAGDKSQAFITKAYRAAAANPEVLPRKFDLDEMRKDVELEAMFSPIYNRFRSLFDKISDSNSVINSEGYAAALVVYRYVRVDDDPEMAATADDLAQRFARKAKAAAADGPATSEAAGPAKTPGK